MATETAICRHHWIIEAAAGPSSPGVCRLCGEVREFSNSVPDNGWASNSGNRGFGNRPGRQPKQAAE